MADAWFELGKTTFDLSSAAVDIKSVSFETDRSAVIECDIDQLEGLTVSFRTKNTFYFHEGSAIVE